MSFSFCFVSWIIVSLLPFWHGKVNLELRWHLDNKCLVLEKVEREQQQQQKKTGGLKYGEHPKVHQVIAYVRRKAENYLMFRSHLIYPELYQIYKPIVIKHTCHACKICPWLGMSLKTQVVL